MHNYACLTPNSTIVLVSYSLTTCEDRLENASNAFAATVRAPSNYKDEAKIREYVTNAVSGFGTSHDKDPYIASFSKVVITLPQYGQAAEWDVSTRQNKSSVAAACIGFMKKYLLYADAPPFDLFGFGIHRFLEVLFAECAIEGILLPPRLRQGVAWAARDVMSVLFPNDRGTAEWQLRSALQAFGPDINGVSTAMFLPGVDVKHDQLVMLELFERFSLVTRA